MNILRSILLVFSGVYWLPGLAEAVGSIKYGFLIIAITPLLKTSFNRKLFYYLLLMSLCVVTIIWRSKVSMEALQYIFSTIIGFSFIMHVSTLAQADIDSIVKWIPVLTFLLIGLYVLAFSIGSVNPYNGFIFTRTGFNAKSTGWSVFLFQLFALNCFVAFWSLRIRIFNFLLLMCLLYLMVLSEGRSGLLSSFIFSFLLIYVLIRSKSRLIIFAALTLLIVLSIGSYGAEIFTYLIRDSKSLDLNDITTNRWIQYAIFNTLPISHYVFLGGGYHHTIDLMIDLQGLPLEFHNHIVRIVLDHGMLFGGVIILGVYFIVTRRNELWRFRKIYFITLLVIVMSEPNVLIGSFWNSLITWFFLGIGWNKSLMYG